MAEAGIKTIHLSKQACSLWAKSDYGAGERWLPLYMHMFDSAAVAERLWDAWVPENTKRIVARSLGDDGAAAKRIAIFLAAVHDIGKATPIFQATRLSFADDSEETSLRYKPEKAGLAFPPILNMRHGPKHPIAGQAIFERYMERRCRGAKWLTRSFSSVIGCHHGIPPENNSLIDARKNFPKEMGFEGPGKDDWSSTQDELIRFAMDIAGLTDSDEALFGTRFLDPQAASLLTGFVIMCDWIASNQELFPLISLVPLENESFRDADGLLDVEALKRRAQHGWDELGIGASWKGRLQECPTSASEFFKSRFSLPSGSEPYSIQVATLDIARNVSDVGIIIVEASMGEGKTETALAAAEVMAIRAGRGGVCVALPTMATTDAMFSRVHEWLERLTQAQGSGASSVYLAHGKARLNEEYQGIVGSSFRSAGLMGQDLCGREDDYVYVDGWMRGRKRGMLANFLVCTVDQVLMAALETKHLSLRHLALANKVVIIDECHAYDAYMREYLNRALEWLGSWGVPVVLLSATLPENLRRTMVESYLKGKAALRIGDERLPKEPPIEASENAPDAYPLITYTEGMSVKYQSVPSSGRKSVVRLSVIPDDEESLIRLLDEKLAEGGVAGVVCDTVARAQHVFRALQVEVHDADLMLVHSRFIDLDRMGNEKRIRDSLGPKATAANGLRPHKAIVVGTQVLEQSLDIDFDVMVLDVAPVDLMMQRLGRLHRHARGDNEADRPKRLRDACAFARGVELREGKPPRFDRGVLAVYQQAALMEALAVLGLTGLGEQVTLHFPRDIAEKVRCAYSEKAVAAVPADWRADYDEAVKSREGAVKEKTKRADACLLPSVYEMRRHQRSLTDWFQRRIEEKRSGLVDREEQKAERAVRDTQETVEVLLLEETDEGLRLFPWVGDERHGVSKGASVPINSVPPTALAKVVAQCAVRLPASMCNSVDIDDLIDELESRCGPRVATWQESSWLSGRLALFLRRKPDGSFSTELSMKGADFIVSYSRVEGLAVKRAAKGA